MKDRLQQLQVACYHSTLYLIAGISDIDMKCKYCGCRDESELAMRSTRAGDEVIHDWICLSCLWTFFLTLKVSVEKHGRAILSEAGKAAGRMLTARDIHPFSL